MSKLRYMIKSSWQAGIVLLLTAMLGFGGCNLFQKDDSNDNAALLLLLLAASGNQSSSSCQNNSGLVICIPPGLRF